MSVTGQLYTLPWINMTWFMMTRVRIYMSVLFLPVDILVMETFHNLAKDGHSQDSV